MAKKLRIRCQLTLFMSGLDRVNLAMPRSQAVHTIVYVACMYSMGGVGVARYDAVASIVCACLVGNGRLESLW